MGPGRGVAGGRRQARRRHCAPSRPQPVSSSGFPYLSLLPFLPRLHHPLHGLPSASGTLAYLRGGGGCRAGRKQSSQLSRGPGLSGPPSPSMKTELILTPFSWGGHPPPHTHTHSALGVLSGASSLLAGIRSLLHRRP